MKKPPSFVNEVRALQSGSTRGEYEDCHQPLDARSTVIEQTDPIHLRCWQPEHAVTIKERCVYPMQAGIDDQRINTPIGSPDLYRDIRPVILKIGQHLRRFAHPYRDIDARRLK